MSVRETKMLPSKSLQYFANCKFVTIETDKCSNIAADS